MSDVLITAADTADGLRVGADAALTPVSDETLAIIKLASREPSGVVWVSRFPCSTALDDLVSPFREGVSAFIGALRDAGATVSVAATVRPVERAYLMHWSWQIANRGKDPRSVPGMDGVNIRWDHRDSEGNYLASCSVDAAKAMTVAYGTDKFSLSPPLRSRRTARCAADIAIRWRGALHIRSAAGTDVCISQGPRTGMNRQLERVGVTYGVIKFNQPGKDRPHWSDTGTW